MLPACKMGRASYKITDHRLSVPDGKAVYSKKGEIHSDAALTGELAVEYTIATDGSTVLLQDVTGEQAQLAFRKI